MSFTTRDGRRIEAWPDYWQRFGELIDLAYDDYNLRTQITVFADAQLLPKKGDRVEHLRRLLAEVVPGREHKILLIEVANEAWQNGFPGDEGVADLREFARYLGARTEIPIAITSNHDGPGADGSEAFERVYNGGVADLATWHFSRDRRTDDGWKPVYDCWDFGERPGLPPVVSNEPIGPGSSVNAEKEPVRLVAAAAFAYASKLPAYVFHSEAGVFGKTRFEKTPGIDRFGPVLRLLPNDLPSWDRNDGKQPEAPFTAFAGGLSDRYRPEVESARDGCVRNVGGRRGDRFVCVPIGIGPAGLTLQARHAVGFTAYDPLSGEAVTTATLEVGERFTLPPGPGALLLMGRVPASDGDLGPEVRARGEVGCGPDAKRVKRPSITEPELDAPFTSCFDRVERANNGQVSFTPNLPDPWMSLESPDASDGLEIDFGKLRRLTRVELVIYDDRGCAQAPQDYLFEYWNHRSWKRAENQQKSPARPPGRQINEIQFRPAEAAKRRVVFKHRTEARSGVSEIFVWPE